MQLVTLRLQSRKREPQMLVLSSPFSFYTVQDPSPGNGATHSGRVFQPQKLIKIIPHRHAYRLISQVTPSLIKLTIEIKYYTYL